METGAQEGCRRLLFHARRRRAGRGDSAQEQPGGGVRAQKLVSAVARCLGVVYTVVMVYLSSCALLWHRRCVGCIFLVFPSAFVVFVWLLFSCCCWSGRAGVRDRVVAFALDSNDSVVPVVVVLLVRMFSRGLVRVSVELSDLPVLPAFRVTVWSLRVGVQLAGAGVVVSRCSPRQKSGSPPRCQWSSSPGVNGKVRVRLDREVRRLGEGSVLHSSCALVASWPMSAT